MGIVYYFAVVRRWLWLIVLCTGLAGGGAYWVSTKIDPTYEATATLLLRQSSASGELSYDNLLAVQQMAQTYSRILVQHPVLSVVVRNLGLEDDLTEVSERIRADAMPNTSLIKIVASDSDAQRSAAIANEVAKVFIQQHREREIEYFLSMRGTVEVQLQRLDESIRTLQGRINVGEGPDRIEMEHELQILQSNRSALSSAAAETLLGEARLANEVSVVEPAQPPDLPSTPRPVLNGAAGAFAGFALTLVIAFMAEFSRQARALSETA